MASGARAAMRSTMPRGASVQRETQSMKSRKGLRRGGQGSGSATALRLSPPVSRIDQTTPIARRVPSGTATNCPGVSPREAGAR